MLDIQSASKVPVNSLSLWSEWPKRLLGLSEWNIIERTLNKIEQEYNNDKYLKCLKFFQESRTTVTANDIRNFEVKLNLDREICISAGENLYTASETEAREHYYGLIKQEIIPLISKSSRIIELGCGYGFNLWFLNGATSGGVQGLGGEYSLNAVELGRALFKDEPNMDIQQFNFYDKESYSILESEENKKFLVFTSHAIEQLPSARSFVENIKNHRRVVSRVVNLEPIYEAYDESLLGLLRKRYTQFNDYNQDLLTILQSDPEIKIHKIVPNYFGINPLNPTSIIEWSFH
jgi:SAM-dependent methyltransferase